MKLPDGYEAHLAPRSSTYSKYGVIQANSVGVVDNSYCGPSDWWYFPAIALEKDVEIKKGDRICQFRIMEKQPAIKFVEGKMTDKYCYHYLEMVNSSRCFIHSTHHSVLNIH